MRLSYFYALLHVLIVLSTIAVFADTPPPGTVKAKMFSGDGNTSFTATGTALDVNVTNTSGLTTVNQGTAGASPWLVDGSAHTQPVSGIFWQSIQPVSGTLTCNAGSGTLAVSGPLTDTQLRASAVPVTGTITATNSANGATGSAAPAQATQVGGSDGTNLRAIKVSNAGVVSVDGSATTQPVSAASLPLPAGASTSALQSTINSTLGSPFQAGGSIGNSAFGISGTLPAYAATPTFNLGTLNGAATSTLQTTGNTSLATIATNTTNAGTPVVTGTVTANAGTGTFAVSAASLPLPAGASTSSLQTTGNTSLSSIDGKTPALGQALSAASVPVVLPAAQITTLTPPTTVTVTQGTGTNLHTVVDSGTVTANAGTGTFAVSAASLPLPTGAATSSAQTTAQTSLSSIDTKTPALGQALSAASVPVVLPAAQITTLTPLSSVTVTQATGTNLHTVVDSGTVTANAGTGTFAVSAASLPLPTGAATSSAQTTAQTSLSTIATNTTNIPVVGATDSQTTGTVSTVITLTAPSNAQGFILQNLQTSTANVRFAMGATATTSLGMQLAPGQDSGFVPTSASVTIVAESGTQNYNIQWVAK